MFDNFTLLYINLLIYHEIFVINAYNAKKEEIKDKVVIDVGANFGAFSFLASGMGAKKIIAIEPDYKNYVCLLENITKYKTTNIIPIYKALASENDKMVFMEGDGVLAKTTDIPNGTKAVKTYTLQYVYDLLEVEKEHAILKIDTEGAEYDILLSANPELLSKFEYIYAELHLTENHSPDEIISLLKSLSFNLVSTYIFYNNFEDGHKEENPNKVYKFEKQKQS